MATKMVIRDGVATGVYDDKWRILFEAMGPLKVERASEVEYDEGTGEWVARLLKTGQEIARGRDRNEVIRAEVAWLEKEVIK